MVRPSSSNILVVLWTLDLARKNKKSGFELGFNIITAIMLIFWTSCQLDQAKIYEVTNVLIKYLNTNYKIRQFFKFELAAIFLTNCKGYGYNCWNNFVEQTFFFTENWFIFCQLDLRLSHTFALEKNLHWDKKCGRRFMLLIG